MSFVLCTATKSSAVITVGDNGIRLIELGDAQRRWLDDDSLDVARAVCCIDLSAAPGVSIGSPAQADRLHAVARLLVSADALGALSSTLDRLTAYLKERIAFGVPIASFQAVQHRLVELLVLRGQGARNRHQSGAHAGGCRFCRRSRPPECGRPVGGGARFRQREGDRGRRRVHAAVRRYRVHLGVPPALRTAPSLQRMPRLSGPRDPAGRCLRRCRAGERRSGHVPAMPQLKTFRDSVRKFIAENAPPIEAREGHRAPVDATQEASLRDMVRRPLRRRLRRGRLARRARRAAPTTTRCTTASSARRSCERARRDRSTRSTLPPMCCCTSAANAAERLLLPPIRRSEHVWCQLLSEPDAGSDIAAVRSRAVGIRRRRRG